MVAHTPLWCRIGNELISSGLRGVFLNNRQYTVYQLNLQKAFQQPASEGFA
jgi:hypothetical protein